MKYLYLLILLTGVTVSATAQNTITSVADGQATNPFIWDCTCIPMPGDNVTINHDVQMNADWISNGNGSITVSMGASFIEDAQHRTVLFDGGSTFTNHGLTELTNIAFTNGAEGHNHSTLSLDTALWVGNGSTFMNHAVVQDVDSTYIQGMFMNEGSYSHGLFLNEGMIDNSGYIAADSMLNTGTLNSSAGNIQVIAFANTGETNITGSSYMLVSGDFYNSGRFYLATGRDVRIQNSLLNSNNADTAVIINDGLFEVANDFSNVDTLRGSGIFCIANASSNFGEVKGTLDICDNTSVSHFDFNSGNIEPTVTNCSSGCSVGLSDNEITTEFSVYPNPAEDLLHISGPGYSSIRIVDVTGKTVYEKLSPTDKIDVSKFKRGVYFITFRGEKELITRKFIKK
ncbi:MAG: T9SS type A sorting domain-containing protein [Brumimicrobium sp.]|nr:T9SS type A sorting domain-containing protein [Brumimicrobium sp.]